MNYRTDSLSGDMILVIIFAVITGLFLLLVLFVNWYLPFKAKRDYIKMEMSRSFTEKEYLYWESKLKKHYKRNIPLIGRFFR